MRLELLAERKGADDKWTVDKVLLAKGSGAWRDRPLASIDRHEVKRVIWAYYDEGRSIQANRLLAYVKKFFAYCADEGLVETSPALHVKKPAKEVKRDHVLSDEEIRAIWHACDGLHIFGRAIRVLLLTGQRRTEVASMGWSEVDFVNRVWTLPPARTKAGRAHTVPLSDMAFELIKDAPKLGKHVFTSGHRDNAPISSWVRSSANLTTRSRKIAANRFQNGICMICEERPRQGWQS
jgi:integrase